MSAPDNEELAYDADYKDPQADMVLRSLDKVCFRVQQYYLKASSRFFRDMPTHSDAPPGKRDEVVIDIDGQPQVLRILLDIVTGSPRRPLANIQWAKFEPLVDLGKQYDFDALPRLMALDLDWLNMIEPMRMFVFASQQDMETIAAACIARLGDNRDWACEQISEVNAAYLKDVPPVYIVALFQAMRASEDPYRQVKWTDAAQSFAIQRS